MERGQNEAIVSLYFHRLPGVPILVHDIRESLVICLFVSQNYLAAKKRAKAEETLHPQIMI
jgi:hypothetical protein